jgi:transposase
MKKQVDASSYTTSWDTTVGLIAAVTFMVEVGDVRRFETPRQLMAKLSRR